MRQFAAGLILVITLCLGGCAASPTGAPRDPLAQAVSQPVRDLSLVRHDLPDILRGALAAPYRLETPPSCASLTVEIGVLDGVLGPDVDDAKADGNDAGARILAGAMPGLPFRGVVREVTGAGPRDREMQRALLAGLARRSYLKGLAHGLGCARP